MTTPLPNSFTVRPATIDDVERAAELANLCSIDLTGRPATNADELRIDWLLPSSNPETDIRLVFANAGLSSGALVGYAGVWDAAPHVQVHSWCHVHPEYRAQGVAEVLLDWIEARARQAIAKAPDGARVSVGQMRPSADGAGGERMLARGYSVMRHVREMQIEMDAPPPPPIFPEGLRTSSMAELAGTHADQVRAVTLADQEIFRDFEQPIDEAVADWIHWVDNDPHHDPKLWFLAMQGDQIVGVSLCSPQSPQDPDMAWVISLGVKRSWRRQGIALAMLHYTFGQFFQRGVRKVGLGVDGQSLTGATRLYEKAGMRPVYEETLYEKELRPGVELATQSLAEAGSGD